VGFFSHPLKTRKGVGCSVGVRERGGASFKNEALGQEPTILSCLHELHSNNDTCVCAFVLSVPSHGLRMVHLLCVQ